MSGLTDLFEQLIGAGKRSIQSVENPPVYAQNRWTHDPTYIGYTGDTPEPNTGLTEDVRDRPGDKTLMNLGDQTDLIRGGIQRGLGVSVAHMPMQGTSVIYLSPDSQAARHESIHALLNSQNVQDELFHHSLDDLGTTGQALRQGWMTADRLGNIEHELPAYMGEYARTGKSEIPGITPKQRDDYLTHFTMLLRDRRGSKAASAFQRMIQPISSDEAEATQ